MGKQTRRLAVSLLSGVLLMMVIMPVKAETIEGERGGPGVVSDALEEVPGSVIPEYLTDQILEYSEIQEMIHYFNPTIQNTNLTKEENRRAYTDAHTVLSNEADNVKRQKQNAKDDGDMDSYYEYDGQETVLRSTAKSYQTMLNRLDAYSSNKSVLQTERQLTVAAQSLMISHASLSNQKTTQEKMLEVYQQSLTSTRSRYSAGMATQLDVLNAENQILTAESALLDLDNSIRTIYESLCLLLGQDASAGMQLAAIPALEQDAVGERNPEEDIDTATGNNYTLIQYRTTLGTTTTSATEYKFRTIAEGEEKLTIQIQKLYQDVVQTRDALDVASLSYEQAFLQKRNADTSYRIGVLSKDDYLKQELNYLQKEAGKASAELEYLQAVTTYDWAITGIADIE